MSGIDAQVDELYALPLGEFTAARNRLARTFKGAAAAHVKQLAKPTTIAWAVNQLYWHDRSVWQRLMQAGRALRSAQIAALEGRRADVDVRQAADAHRRALAGAVECVLARASATGAHPPADQVTRMLETISLSEHVERPGRFTELVQPSGFEALAGVTPMTRPGSPAPSAGTREPKPSAANAAARHAAEAALLRAERAAQEAEGARTRADEELRSAQQRLREAEQLLARRDDELAAARRELARAREELRRLE